VDYDLAANNLTLGNPYENLLFDPERDFLNFSGVADNVAHSSEKVGWRGKHTLRIRIAGENAFLRDFMALWKNDESRSIMVGMDCLAGAGERRRLCLRLCGPHASPGGVERRSCH
jgi:hypothetical protein